MELDTALLAIAALGASAVLTALARKFALSHGILDIPNDRSSHSAATPRGGGMAIVVTATTSMLILLLFGRVPRELCLVLVGGGTAVAAAGFWDDRRRLSPAVRLVVHVLAAAWAVGWLGGVNDVRVGDNFAHLGWAGSVLAVLGIVWVVNLFNFMDGIDAIAASEAAFVAGAGALLSVLSGSMASVPAVALAFAATCCGFLVWNWPPARIFMGDVGSGYLGFVLSVLALAAARDNSAGLWIWLILGGVFFVDATVTLVRRLTRRERFYQAHRTHGYQWLARRWGSHRRVTIAVLTVNVFWLLPCALYAALRPRYAAAATVVALAPLVVIAFAVGSGRPEASEHT